MDKNLDTTFEDRWKKRFEKYVQDFETGRKKARNIQVYIEHCERQIICDFPTTSSGNYYIKDVIYYFYHLYNLGSSISEILEKVNELRKEHLAKAPEKPNNYERSYDGFNLEIEDQSAIIDFLTHHFAKKQFLEFLKSQMNKAKDVELGNVNPYENDSAENLDDKKQKPTNAQKLLALYYLQKVNLFPSTFDVLPLSEFISFLTGQNKKNTYDYWRELDDKKSKKNLLAVKQQFERIKLTEAVKMIDEDLKNCQR